MPKGKDYLGMLKAEPGDKLDYGVKGMKWGVRKADTRLPPRSHDGGGGGKKDDTRLPPRSHEGGGKKDSTRLPPRSHEQKLQSTENDNKGISAKEPSAERYAKLREQAKLGKAHLMSEDDLKWFNARTDALAKVNKLNQRDPGWIKKATTQVLQNTAQKAMQDISQHAAEKFIVLPINESVGKAAAKEAAKRAARAAAKK